MVTRFAQSAFAFFVCTAPLAADEIKAATMAEALEKIPCEHVAKEGDGLWSATDAIEVPNARSEHPQISDPKRTLKAVSSQAELRRGDAIERGTGC